MKTLSEKLNENTNTIIQYISVDTTGINIQNLEEVIKMYGWTWMNDGNGHLQFGVSLLKDIDKCMAVCRLYNLEPTIEEFRQPMFKNLPSSPGWGGKATPVITINNDVQQAIDLLLKNGYTITK